jgi:hypothetical protein
MSAALNWNNKIGRLGWTWKPSRNIQLNTVYYFNCFSSGQNQHRFDYVEIENELEMNTSLKEHDIKTVLHYRLNKFDIETGIEVKWQKYCPSNKILYTESNTNTIYEKEYKPFSAMIFGDLNFNGNKYISTLGTRGTFYQIGDFKTFATDIHFNFQYFFKKTFGLEFSFDKLSQFRHIVEGLPTGWALDLIIPSNSRFQPENARQLYLGNFWMNDIASVCCGVYYKKMNNLVSYINASNVFSTGNISWETDATSGKGESYGFELHTELTLGNVTNTLSYTLSKTDRQFDEINGGDWYPAKFDRRHILNVQSQFITLKGNNKNQLFDITLSLTSGHHATIPVGIYEGVLPPFWEVSGGGLNAPDEMDENAYYRKLMSDKNGFQMPAYFRIDLGYSFIKRKPRYERELRLGIYNVLNRKNPYLVFYEDGKWKQLSIIPILPSISYSLRFK